MMEAIVSKESQQYLAFKVLEEEITGPKTIQVHDLRHRQRSQFCCRWKKVFLLA